MIEDAEVSWLIQGEPEPLQRCLGLSEQPLASLEPDVRRRIEQDISTWFLEHNPVKIDGQLVKPEIRRLELPVDDPDEDGWFTVEIDLVYPCQEPPRSVSIVWDNFDGTEWGGEAYVPILVKEPGNSYMSSLWAEEPEHIWHASATPARRAAPVEEIMGTRDTVSWSWRAAILGFAGVIFLTLTCFGKMRPLRGASAGLLALGAGVLLWTHDTGSVKRIRLPAQEQVLELFESLHRNVYAAFEARTEDEIYELLAKSLDASILDEQYAEIYESMILREQGGAVCSLDGIEVLERAVTLEPERSGEGPRFEVDWTWRVKGAVAHWGHLHRRTNHYRALYTVRHDGRSWKIADVRVQEHSRIEK